MRVESLCIYPIKSCKGVSITAGQVTSTGFAFDRQLAVVNAKTGRCLTQRQLPQMALIEVTLPIEVISGQWDKLPADACLKVNAPDMETLQIPLRRMSDTKPLCQTSVWEWSGDAADEGEVAATWFSKYLGRPCRLVRYVGGSAGAPTYRFTKPEWLEGGTVAFADGFPYLLASKESLDEVNSRLPTPINMNRFRPNITLSGGAAFEEDSWLSIVIKGKDGTVELKTIKPCDRCTVPDVCQEDGTVGKVATNVLRSFRTGKELQWDYVKGFGSAAFFGVNCTATGSSGSISVGDEVQFVHPRTQWVKVTTAAA